MAMVWTLQDKPTLTDKQLESWSRLLESKTGVQLSGAQRTHFQSQLAIRMRELQMFDVDAYFEKVTDSVRGAVEWSILLDRLVVKETSFFRHPASMILVRKKFIESLKTRPDNYSFDVWSVACSTGEESYSLAMVLQDVCDQYRQESYFSVTGSDVSGQAISVARQGVYGRRKVSQFSKKWRQRFFQASDNDCAEVSQIVKNRVCFSRFNILEVEASPAVKFDVIYCQNLLVYFRRWLRRHLLNEMVKRLKPAGVLVLGPGEVTDWTHKSVRREEDSRTLAFCRVD